MPYENLTEKNSDGSLTVVATAFCMVSHDVQVSVAPIFLVEQSFPENNHYLWLYHVTIENQRSHQIQILTRYWHIVDAYGKIQEVRGDGVVGQQPIIKPGKSYEYVSSIPLTTPSGLMRGLYHGRANKQDLEIVIPTFSLDSPYQSATHH